MRWERILGGKAESSRVRQQPQRHVNRVCKWLGYTCEIEVFRWEVEQSTGLEYKAVAEKLPQRVWEIFQSRKPSEHGSACGYRKKCWKTIFLLLLFKMRRDEETQTLQAVKGPSILEMEGLGMCTIIEREKECPEKTLRGWKLGLRKDQRLIPVPS